MVCYVLPVCLFCCGVVYFVVFSVCAFVLCMWSVVIWCHCVAVVRVVVVFDVSVCCVWC